MPAPSTPSPTTRLAPAGALTLLLALTACGGGAAVTPHGSPQTPMTGTVRIGYLHHSTGGVVWNGGVSDYIARWAKPSGTTYTISEQNYPVAPAGGYPWDNYPYDYWNLWVRNTGGSRDRGELNLDDLAAAHDVIVFKHCYPVSSVEPDGPTPDVTSPAKTLANYQLQYAALKARMREFPAKRFIVWTGAALIEAATDPAQAARARQFAAWVKETWDEPGDNIFVWDFRELETNGGLYLLPAYSAGDSHPNATFAIQAAPLIGKRIVDVIEGRGDTGSLTGR